MNTPRWKQWVAYPTVFVLYLIHGTARAVYVWIADVTQEAIVAIDNWLAPHRRRY